MRDGRESEGGENVFKKDRERKGERGKKCLKKEDDGRCVERMWVGSAKNEVREIAMMVRKRGEWKRRKIEK